MWVGLGRHVQPFAYWPLLTLRRWCALAFGWAPTLTNMQPFGEVAAIVTARTEQLAEADRRHQKAQRR